MTHSGTPPSDRLELQDRLNRLAVQLTELTIEHSQLVSALAQSETSAVRHRVESLGKVIREVQNQSLKLPLTVPIYEALVVRVGGQRYFLRLDRVIEVLRPGLATLTVDGSVEYVKTRDGQVPVMRLTDWLGCRTSEALEGVGAALIVARPDGARLAIVVDDVLETQQIIVRPLSSELAALPGFAGGALMQDGSAALVLDLQQVLEVAS